MPKTREDFAIALMKEMGWEDTRRRRLILYAWMCSENTEAKNNPMATTHDMDGATDFNTTHVKNYKSLKQGVQATADTLRNGRYTNILSHMDADHSAWLTAFAIVRSPWGTHDFFAGLWTARHRDTSQTLLGQKS